MNRTLVEQLAKVNPIHLSNDEKLAFWINLYNAMIMHVSSFSKPWCIWVKFNSKKFRLILVCSYQGYLAYGVPKSDLKLFSLMQKVSFNFMLVFFLFHQPFFIYIYIYVWSDIIALWWSWLLLQAAYTVGGHSFTATSIEFGILKLKPPLHRPQIVRSSFPLFYLWDYKQFVRWNIGDWKRPIY